MKCTFCGDTDECCPCNDPCRKCGEPEALCRCVALCSECNFLVVANVEDRPCKGLYCSLSRFDPDTKRFWLEDCF